MIAGMVRIYFEIYSCHVALVVKNPPANAGDVETCVRSCIGGRFFTTSATWEEKLLFLNFPQRRTWQSTPVFLPGESHGQRNLVGYSPQGRKELDTIEATQHALVRSHQTFSKVAIFAFPPARRESCCGFTSLPALGGGSVLAFGGLCF